MGIWKEKMSRKWEGGEVKKTMMKKKGRAGVGEFGKGCFFYFHFQKLPILKRDFFLSLGSVLFLPARLYKKINAVFSAVR